MESSEHSPEPAASGETSDGKLCPKCGSGRVHRSHRRGALERMLCLAGGRIRRCHDCNRRFLYSGGSTIFVEDVLRFLRKAAWGLAILAAILVVTITLLLLSNSQAPPSS